MTELEMLKAKRNEIDKRIKELERSETNAIAGAEIKETCKNEGIKLWRVAEIYGVTPQRFSELLRHEFTRENASKVMYAVEKAREEIA